MGDHMEVLAKLPAAEHRDGDLKLVLKALSAFRRGEQGVTLPTEWDGLYGKIAAEFNELSAQTAPHLQQAEDRRRRLAQRRAGPARGRGQAHRLLAGKRPSVNEPARRGGAVASERTAPFWAASPN